MTATCRRCLFLSAIIALASCAGADGPAPAARVVSATDLGAIECSPDIRGRDGGYSALFAGRSVWLYGDTTIAERGADGRSWRHNSWSWTRDLDPADGISGFTEPRDTVGAPTEFFPQTPDERAFNNIHFVDECTVEPCGARWAVWPGVMVPDPERGRALIFYYLIYAEPGDFNFHGVGSSVAVWEDFDSLPQRPELSPGTAHPTLMFGEDEPSFGSAAVEAVGDLFVYACGSEGLKKPCRLGRVPLADVLDRSAWTFYAGQGEWSPRLDDARSVLQSNDMMTVAWNAYLGCYLAIYSQPMARRVMLRTAPAPEGPWSAAIEVFEALKPESGSWVYDALAHPELGREEGRIQYVSYSHGTGFLASEMRLVEVVLSKPAAGEP